jgi:hypothetical protein
VGANPEHVKFFRFRSALTLKGEGSRGDLWLTESIAYLDINQDFLLRQYFFISHYSKGGYSYETIMGMTYKNFKIILDEAKKIQKILVGEEE